jgi:molybdopterin/thiamine biosynthesis adenylyltransferase
VALWRDRDHRTLFHYSLHNTSRAQFVGSDWAAYYAELAAAVQLHSLADVPVLLVGLGGLGTFFAWNLAFDCRQARRGSHRDFVDDDTYSPSNCNRQIFCSAGDIGRSKADVVCDVSAAIDAASDYRPHQERLDTQEKLRPLVASADVAIAAVDNDFARLQLADAAAESKTWFLTGGTNYCSGYVHVQPPDRASFRHSTRVADQPIERLQRSRSCGVGEASTIFPNAVCASLGYLELSEAMAGRPYQNLRYFADAPDNCIHPMTTCRS